MHAPRSPNYIDKHLGRRIKRARRDKDLTQCQVAAMIDVTHQQFQKYETGSNRLPARRLYDLAIALDLPIDYFFDGLEGLNSRNMVIEPRLDEEGAVALATVQTMIGRLVDRLHYPATQAKAAK